MEKLKLIPQAKLNNKRKDVQITQYLDTEYIEKILNDLLKSIEKLEDKINEIEH